MGTTKIPPKGSVSIVSMPVHGDGRYTRVFSGAPGAGSRMGSSPHPAEGLLPALTSPCLAEVRHAAERMARTDLPILMLGDNGIAQEAASLMIHWYSSRRDRPFGRMSCRAAAAAELEPKLFGSEVETAWEFEAPERGLFEACNGGTVFLDSVTTLPWHLQGRLVDLLDDHRLYRMNGQSWLDVDVRILASTSLDIDWALTTGRLRWDLYQRLNCLTLHFPRLEEQGAASWKGRVNLEKNTSDWPTDA